MGYREREKQRLVPLKPALFSKPARAPGRYKGKVYDFCLAEGFSSENLHQSIRDEALQYFETRGIGWHDGPGKSRELPSNHLCCSQTACVNFLFPFVRASTSLTNVLNDIGLPALDVLPFDGDSPLKDGAAPFVVFEWIGKHNYLDELKLGRVAKDSERTRGANFTSADFAFKFRRPDGKTEIVLGEWKYTERYAAGKSIQISNSGTDRLDRVYRKHLESTDCQIRLPSGIRYEDLFYDPFDQMMRLQLLASAIERNCEEADIVSVLHVVPKANEDLTCRITSPRLSEAFPNSNIHEVQHRLVPNNRFRSLYTEDLLPVIVRHAPDQDWATYMAMRYAGF